MTLGSSVVVKVAMSGGEDEMVVSVPSMAHDN